MPPPDYRAPRSADDDLAPELNARIDGWNAATGLRFVRATIEEVVAEIAIADHHRMPYGVVHGGVYCGIIETVASVGAALNALVHGRAAVGLENATAFLHAVREGTLRVRATPVSRGKRTHVWSAEVTDDANRVVATGRVRMMILEADARLGGEAVGLRPSAGQSEGG